MRPLEKTNPEFARPSQFFKVGAIIPVLLGLGCLALIDGATPNLPLRENPLIFAIAAVIIVGCVLVPVSMLFNWGWETGYFGIQGFFIASVTLLGIVPALCIVLYGNSPLILRLLVFSTYLLAHVFWCRRFVVYYRQVFDNDELRVLLYQEDADAVYYVQRADKLIFEKRRKFAQMPSDRYFACAGILAIAMIFDMRGISTVTGLPLTHCFLTVIGFPISLLGAGQATRAWLIFYYYPMQLRAATGKRVYVDLTGAPSWR